MAKQGRPPHERLKAWRELAGHSQKEAADLAGFGQGTWSFIERGERQPTLEQAFRLQSLTGGAVKAEEWLHEAGFRQTG